LTSSGLVHLAGSVSIHQTKSTVWHSPPSPLSQDS